MKKILAVSLCLCVISSVVWADTFGTGANQFTIDFVNIGNAGNAPDAGGTPGCGAVGYNYRIGKYEVTNAQWNAFTTAAGAPTGNDGGYWENAYWTNARQPTTNVSWYEATQFCNFLTSGDKSKGAYRFSGNNANPGSFLGIDRVSAISTYGTTYVIPTEDEWYKAAYYTGSGYSLYANGQNTIPAADNGWNYNGGVYGIPWNVGTGALEQNGTKDMMGNVFEWNETFLTGRQFRGFRWIRGGAFNDGDVHYLNSSSCASLTPVSGCYAIGFRVASVPEPCSLTLLFLGGLALRYRKR